MNQKKNVIYWFLLFFGVAGILDTLFLLGFSNMDLGVIFPGVMGIFIIIYVFIKHSTDGKPIIRSIFIRKIVFYSILLFILSFISVQSILIYNGTLQQDVETDYLIILGSGIRGDVVSETLKLRLDKGIEYLIKYPDVKVVVSGGQGNGETIPEAEAMKRYLVYKGVNPERILKEDKSRNTMENFKFSKEILEKVNALNYNNLMIISSDFHMLRAKMLAKKNGFIPYGIGSRTPSPVILNCYVREYFALIKSYIYFLR